MGFIDAVKNCLGKYVVFSGRARRSEYWWFALFILIVSLMAGIIDLALGFGTVATQVGDRSFATTAESSGPVGALTTLALIAPAISVGVRRLHDADRSGWWLWISLIPLIGFIVLLVFFLQSGTSGANRFGPDPKPFHEGAPQ